MFPFRLCLLAIFKNGNNEVICLVEFLHVCMFVDYILMAVFHIFFGFLYFPYIGSYI